MPGAPSPVKTGAPIGRRRPRPHRGRRQLFREPAPWRRAHCFNQKRHVFDLHPDPSRIIPSRPPGPDMLRSIRDRLEEADRNRPVILDLSHAPINTPGHVASVLWIEGVARDLGLDLEIFTPDMASAELLDFAGVNAPVFAGNEAPAGEP